MDLNSMLEVVVEPRDPDITLVEDFSAGDATAFDRLYHRYSGFVYNTCLGILGNPDDARDALQETFLQVYRALSGFRGRSTLRTWIYRIAVNRCLDMLRGKPTCQPAESLDWLRDAPEQTHDSAVEQRVRETILRLRPEHRAVLVLFHFQELSYSEIADALGCSLDVVRTRLHRARRAFRELYDKGGEDDEM